MNVHRRLARALLVTLPWVTPAAAASQLRHPVPASDARLELSLTRPFLEDQDFGWATAVLVGRVTVPAGSGAALFVEWGVSHASHSLDVYYASPSDYYAPATVTGTATANLVLGAAFGRDDGSSGSLSLSLPAVHQSRDGDVASVVAAYADGDHMERFLEDVWAVEGAFRSSHRLESGARVGFRAAAAALGSTRGGSDTELYGRYALFGRVPAGAAVLGAEVSGVAWLSEGSLTFGERSYHHLSIAAGFPDAAAAPELFLRVPLDSELGDVLKVVVGLRVTF